MLRLQAFVGIADQQADAMQPPVFQADQKFMPVHLLLRQRDRTAADLAFTARIHTQSNQYGAVNGPSALAHLLVAGIQSSIT